MVEPLIHEFNLQQPMGTLSANMKPLKASAQSLRETTLALDTADTQVLYDQLTQLPNRRLFIDRFNQTYLSSRRSIMAINLQCTVSIGITVFLFELGDRRAILQKLATMSNMAMNQAKKAGGNRIQTS